MLNSVTFSTLIDPRVKIAVTALCKRKGLKLRYMVEQALIDRLEDEIDLETYQQRRSEKIVSFADVLAGRKKRKSG